MHVAKQLCCVQMCALGLLRHIVVDHSIGLLCIMLVDTVEPASLLSVPPQEQRMKIVEVKSVLDTLLKT